MGRISAPIEEKRARARAGEQLRMLEDLCVPSL